MKVSDCLGLVAGVEVEAEVPDIRVHLPPDIGTCNQTASSTNTRMVKLVKRSNHCLTKSVRDHNLRDTS